MAVLPAHKPLSFGRGLPLPVCNDECGVTLTLCSADEAYPSVHSAVHCDRCSQRIQSDCLCYHCPMEKTDLHPHGFDLCSMCSFRQITGQDRTPTCDCGEHCSLIRVTRSLSRIKCNRCSRRMHIGEAMWSCRDGRSSEYTHSDRKGHLFHMCSECGLSLTIGADCPCGSPLSWMLWSEMYPLSRMGVMCDECETQVWQPDPSMMIHETDEDEMKLFSSPRITQSHSHSIGFHCRMGRASASHPAGYDVCLPCSYRLSLRKLQKSERVGCTIGGPSSAAASSMKSMTVTDDVHSQGKSNDAIIRRALFNLGLLDEYIGRFEDEQVDDDALEWLGSEQISVLFGGKIGPTIKFGKWLQMYRKEECDEIEVLSDDHLSGATAASAATPTATDSTRMRRISKRTKKINGGGSGVCCVCMDAPVECASVPCGHLCVCEECAPHIKSEQSCPICRTGITDVIKVFAAGHCE